MRGDFRTIILTMGLTMNFLINGKKETEHGTGRGRGIPSRVLPGVGGAGVGGGHSGKVPLVRGGGGEEEGFHRKSCPVGRNWCGRTFG
jgi:hypothetical protein